jgi:hypothetical protein
VEKYALFGFVASGMLANKGEMKMRFVCVFCVSMLAFACTEDDNSSGVACSVAAEHLCVTCEGADDLECVAEIRGLTCEMECKFDQATLDFIAGSTDCSAMWEAWEDNFDKFYLEGSVTATCAELCAKCDECHAKYSRELFSEGDCGDGYDGDADVDCMTYCTAEYDDDLLESLTSLAKPIAEYKCCELDATF